MTFCIFKCNRSSMNCESVVMLETVLRANKQVKNDILTVGDNRFDYAQHAPCNI